MRNLLLVTIFCLTLLWMLDTFLSRVDEEGSVSFRLPGIFELTVEVQDERWASLRVWALRGAALFICLVCSYVWVTSP